MKRVVRGKHKMVFSILVALRFYCFVLFVLLCGTLEMDTYHV